MIRGHGKRRRVCSFTGLAAAWVNRFAAIAALSSLAVTQQDEQEWTVIPPQDLEVPRYLPFELRLQNPTAYANPFWDVSIISRFVSPGGASYFVEGFYYDVGTWMVRFAPVIEGTWTYSVTVVARGGGLRTRGNFTCTPSALHGPLRIDPDNPERLLRDDGFPFQAIGTNFFTYERPSINGQWTAPPDSELAERWSVYFQTYGSHGGNVWRRLVGNEGAGDAEAYPGQIGIWYDSGVDRYSLPRSLALDTEFREARRHDMVVIAALLGAQRAWDRNPMNACNGGPFPAPAGDCGSHAGYPDDFFDLRNGISTRYHRKYFRYMVARYSAFVDVWELFNEFDERDEYDSPPAHGLNEAWKASMANAIRLRHPYNDLVATTRTRNAVAVPDAWQDLHVSHCYSYDPAADLCLHGCGGDQTICAREVDALIDAIPEHPGKPDLIDEFGFSSDMANDDPDHHRIGIWTALHRDTGIVFWDANRRVDCSNPLNCPQDTATSAYLSDLARDLFLVRQRYASGLPNTMRVPAAQPLVAPGWLLRAHAIADPSSGVFSAYVHRHDDHGAIMSGATITIDDLVDEAHEGVWVDPKSGARISAFEFSGPRLYRTIPPFVQDVALLVRPDSPVEILTTSIPAPEHRKPYHHMLSARGGGRPYTWAITSGALPVGMALDAETGLLSGTPRYGGSNRFTVGVVARPLATGGGPSFDQVSLSIQWTRTFQSLAGEDGAIVESAPGSGVGGTVYPGMPRSSGSLRATPRGTRGS